MVRVSVGRINCRNLKAIIVGIGEVVVEHAGHEAPAKVHSNQPLTKVVARVIAEAVVADTINDVHVVQAGDNFFHGLVIDGSGAILIEEVLTVLVLHTENVALNAAIVAEASLNKVAIFVANGELLGNFTEFVPGGGDVSLGEACSCPHVGVVVHGCGHKAVVSIVDLPVYKVAGNADKVRFHIFDRNIVGSHVVDEQVVLAVMHIKDCGTIVALKSERQLGEVIIPRILNESDGHVGVNCSVLIRQRLEQICCTGPEPEFYFDVLAVVNGNIGVILDS